MAIDLDNIIGRVRRIVFDRDSDDYTRSDAEMRLYVGDAVDHILLDYYDFTEFVVTGTQITPTPDRQDAAILSLRTALDITAEDIREASGDAILIQTGDIKLDTSKAPPHLLRLFEWLSKEYTDMITSLNMDGKSSSSSGTGIRVDTYIQDSSSQKAGNSLL